MVIKKLAKFTKLWDEIKHVIGTINEGSKGDYAKDFMKIKFNLDDTLPLNKMLKLSMLTVLLDRFLKKLVKKFF